MSGWYIVPRGWMEDFPKEVFSQAQAFLWSVERAAYEPHQQWFKGRQIWLRRGELVTSVRHMAEAFTWPPSRAKRFQDRMVAVQKWEQRLAWDGAQSPTIVTICNYDQYQSLKAYTGTADGPASETAAEQSRNSGETQDNSRNIRNSRNPTKKILARGQPKLGRGTREKAAGGAA